MAHQIDFSNARENMAYVGDRPWHGLGQKLTPDQPIEVWTREAGLDYEVIPTEVRFFTDNDGMQTMPARKVLYRSDTLAPLSVVSKGYHIVQPKEVMDFFGELVELGGFTLETAGVLDGGKRIWGLAKVNDGAPVIGHDLVRPYILLATSYDASMATTAKFTAIRVVCNNTLTMSAGVGDQHKSESDIEDQAVNTLVRISHMNKFRPDEVRQQLGIVGSVFDQWLIQTKLMAERELSVGQAENFAAKLMQSVMPKGAERDPKDSAGYKRIMNLFNGELIGSELTEGNTRWRMLNAVTEEVDHKRGRSANTRMRSAWFGAGEGLKNRAYEMLASNDDFAVAA